MTARKYPNLLLSFLLFFTASNITGQLPYKLIDGREGNYCSSCKATISSMPREVLFGIQINADGNVYFSMNNTEWFTKIFSGNSYGVTVDLIPKDRYACGKDAGNDETDMLPRGTMLFPVFKPELVKGINGLEQGGLFVKIGRVPPNMLNKEIEGNLVIVNGNNICYYTNFVNIDRSVWKLLPMGLFTDSLLRNEESVSGSQTDFFTYTKKVQVAVPFGKASANLNRNYLHGLYDSLQLASYRIRKVEVRAYSSVEGSEKINNELMRRRADTIVQALKKYQDRLPQVKIIKAENWLDFFNDIAETSFSDLQELSKTVIKQKLTDSSLYKAIEPMLAKHRKAILTIYLETKSAAAAVNNASILTDFDKAVKEKNITAARAIQKELAERIVDAKLPLDYINRLEVPETAEFSSLLNDREVYKYLLKATTEYEALDNFLALDKLAPGNGRINYNICVLRFFMWQYGGDTSLKKILLKQINNLPEMGINATLAKRMLINYHILKCEEDMQAYNYGAKDVSLEIIRKVYSELTMSDEDIYAIAKYYAYYSKNEWAEEIITPRIDKTDISEDLAFYYVNLQFYHPSSFSDDDFRKATLNAINLNRKRFCNFFLSNDRGGASMQLLEYEELKAIYCDACR
jgi:hypothetical protein